MTRVGGEKHESYRVKVVGDFGHVQFVFNQGGHPFATKNDDF
jgi:hypothetical protein